MTESGNHEPLAAAQRALLDAYRTERGMPAAAKTRVRARLDASEAALATKGVDTRWIAAGVAVAAALALVWGVSAFRSDQASVVSGDPSDQAAMHGTDSSALHSVDPSSRGEPSRSHQRSSTAGSTDAPADDRVIKADPALERVPETLNAADEGAPSPPAATGTPRRRSGDRPGSEKAEAVDPQAPQDAPPPIASSAAAQERAILSRAWTALAAGEDGKALSATQDHAAQFPNGVLAVERDAIATIASCNAKRPGWSAKAKAFANDHGKTPLARRVREACGSTAADSASAAQKKTSQ